MAISLKCIEGPLQGESFPLEHGEIFSLGRQNDNQIVLVSPRVSRRHAEIILKGQHAFLRDLASQNGTFINGRKLDSADLGLSIELTAEDRIGLGDFVFQLDMPPETAPPPSHAPPLRSAMPIHDAPMAPQDSHSLQRFYSQIAQLVLAIFEVERFCLMAFAAKEKTLVPCFFANQKTQDPSAAFEPSMMILHQLMNAKKTIFTVDASADERFRDGRSISDSGVRAIICAPILDGTELKGGIYIDTLHRNHKLSPQHETWLEGFAALLAPVLQNP